MVSTEPPSPIQHAVLSDGQFLLKKIPGLASEAGRGGLGLRGALWREISPLCARANMLIGVTLWRGILVLAAAFEDLVCACVRVSASCMGITRAHGDSKT